MLHESVYTKCANRHVQRDRKGLGEEGWGVTAGGDRVSSGDDGNVLELGR